MMMTKRLAASLLNRTTRRQIGSMPKLASLVDAAPPLGVPPPPPPSMKPPAKRAPARKLADQLFEYRTWGDGDVAEVVDFIVDNFINREVLMRTHHASDANARSYIEYCIEEAHEQKASFLARDLGTGRIRGVRVNGIGARSGLELLQDFGTQMNSVAKFMHTAERSLGEEAAGGDDNFMRHVIVCVSPHVIKSGVATRLNEMCLAHARRLGLARLTATCTSALPERLATKCGFRIHRRVSYAQYARDNRSLMSAVEHDAFLRLAERHGHARIMIKDVPSSSSSEDIRC